MPELRWILLVLGALLIGGLWWWELRRSRQTGPTVIAPVEPDARATDRERDRVEPRFDASGGAAADAVEPVSMRADERAIPRGDPPVVTLDDLPDDPDQVVLAREPAAAPARRQEPVIAAQRAERPAPPDTWPDEEVVPDLDAVPTRPADAGARTRFGAPAPAAAEVRTAERVRHDAPRLESARTADAARVEGPRVEPRLGDVAPESRAAAPRATSGRREPSIDTTADLSRSAPPPVLEPTAIAASAGASASSRIGANVASPATASAPAPAAAAGSSLDRPAAAPGLEARRPAPRPASAPPRLAAEPARTAPSEPPPTQQRIVAIRLVAAGTERFDGAELRSALEAEGLRFGKYSIFHRQRADGRALYSVASLVEPGSFDLDRMHVHMFPGVSLFAVFPGPVDAPEVFDDLLATARRLAERLGGVLQDERGGPLSAQRVLGIREELVSFQNLVARVRSRPAG